MLDNFLNIIQCANEGEEKETDGYIQDIEIAEGRKMGKVLERMLTLHLKINSLANRFASLMNFLLFLTALEYYLRCICIYIPNVPIELLLLLLLLFLMKFEVETT